MTESDWVVGDRDRLTFDAFCDTHEKAWIGFARARLRDDAAAHAVVELAKVRVWEEWTRILRAKIPPSHAWAILKEEIGASLAGMMMNGEPLPTQPSVPGWVHSVRTAAERAQHLMETQGGNDQLYAALRRLSERRHDVIVLRYLLDLSDEQIADYLGTTQANVRSTVSQALDRLAASLGGRRGAGR
ncbi:sigma factor-like helix-turn-helix DNA-binding protein [Kitasatospora sp. NPDC057692]|uniref:sigma factor-like helix-turn-helix DNA-binding protein n=1 Tax=Kitasatospora sp. NPDC057692 TaxID=3346215 RepID=UPI003675CA60